MSLKLKQKAAVERLHRRHTAKIGSRLLNAEVPRHILKEIFRQWSFYTSDIQNQVIEIEQYEQTPRS